jgi:hypothetical protein
MAKYLYGASVQGIQEFIFATNKLQEIVGASEIVKGIDKSFEEITKGLHVNILVKAAGNMKAVFDNYDDCQKVILDFEKRIQQGAYGITISQAVIELEGEEYSQQEMNALIERLKVQRNKPSIPLDMYISILGQNPKTARPIHLYNKDEEPLDIASKQKRDAHTVWFNEKRKIDDKFRELKEISALSNGKNKIAVIHVDGNGLGQLIPKLKMPLSEFSTKLDDATKKAYKDAFQEGMKIREVILGGDDLTVICDANIALEFTKNFLQNFEDETKTFIEGGLTACAGIAFCNDKYPFHYAVDLAEALCSASKKHAKKINPDLAPSCLMFHNIQSSNYQSWKKFVQDELTIQNDQEIVRLDFGPYYLSNSSQPLIKDFVNTVEAYRCEGSPISRLRNWLSELGKSKVYAQNLLQRINDVTAQGGKWNCKIMDKNLKYFSKELSNEKLIIFKDKYLKTPIYDIHQIHSVTEAK